MSTDEQVDQPEVNQIEYMEAMLSMDVNEIEDLPEFEFFPNGYYNFKCEKLELEVDEAENKAAIKGIFSLNSLIELKNEDDEDKVPKEGALIGGMWSKEFGVKKFKKIFLPSMQALEADKIQEFLDQAKDLEFAIEIGSRLGKPDDLDEEGNRKVYNDIRMAQLAE